MNHRDCKQILAFIFAAILTGSGEVMLLFHEVGRQEHERLREGIIFVSLTKSERETEKEEEKERKN